MTHKETSEDRRINAMTPEEFKDHQDQKFARRLELALRDCMLKILGETNQFTPRDLMTEAYGLIQDMTVVAQKCKDMQPVVEEDEVDFSVEEEKIPMSKMDNAFDYLVQLVKDGMDYPDAEDRAVTRHQMSPSESSELRRRYDVEECHAEDRTAS